ncbi:hypothetical protein Celaphus_00017270, partial [Cervus elaphus hippelaphus]
MPRKVPLDTSGSESAPVAVREKMRSRFHGSHDLIHRLFVCISGAPSAPGGAWARGHTAGWAGFRAVAGVLQESPQGVTQTLRSAALEDCALCQETLSSSELAAKTRDGDLEGGTRWSLTLSRSGLTSQQRLPSPLPRASPAGVADQLQTNYASDLRSILKTLFQVMATKPETDDKEKLKK